MSNFDLLPLEIYAERIFSQQKDRMPDRNSNYWARYMHLVDGLRASVYPQVNAGLACLSKSPGIYTDHGGAHFDEVVRYAGDLLGVGSESSQNLEIGLNPYELYLLLCAIRVHDAGNIDGREDHEKRATAMIYQYGGNIAKDSAEVQLMGQIAEAHGGVTPSGSKDTIGALPKDDVPIAAATCRPRQVAALVRFADEICEHSHRAANHHLNNQTLPAANTLFHLYAQSVTGAACKPTGCFRLKIDIKTKHLTQKYPHPGIPDEKYLIDEVFDRLLKLDRERRYCNQFLDPRMQTSELNVRISLQEEGAQYAPGVFALSEVRFTEFRIPSKDGYPGAQESWRTDLPEWQGQALAESAEKGWK